MDSTDTKKYEVSLFASTNPFSTSKIDRVVIGGGSVEDIIKEVNLNKLLDEDTDARVFIDDLLIDRSKWNEIIPDAGQTISVKVLPTGGSTGKNVLRVVMMIAVVALSYWAGPAGAAAMGFTQGAGAGFNIAAGVIAAGVGIAGALAVNALVPPTMDATSDAQSGGFGQTAQITGIRNRANPFGPVQRLFGKHKLFPTFAALPYTENYGSDSYLRVLFCVGKGDYTISDMKIGETALSSFSNYAVLEGDLDDVDGLYPNTVTEAALAIEITNAGGYEEQTTEADITEISVDLTLVEGLFRVDEDDGETKWGATGYKVQYRISGSADSWNHFSGSPFSANAKIQTRYSIGFRATGLAVNTYDVRITKTTVDYTLAGPFWDGDSVAYTNKTYWTALRSITHTPPIELENCYLIALRIKATGQLTGIVDTFNCIAEAKLPAWNGSAWTSAGVTRNPAWAFAEVLRGNSNKRPVADANIDGDILLDWATNCAAKSLTFDGIVDRKTTVFELLSAIAAAGRGARALVDNKYAVVQDEPQSTPIQHFSPRNSWGFKGSKIFQDIPHALRCRFINEDSNYQHDEIVVTDDGYYDGDTISATTWLGSTAYSLLDFVEPTTPNGYYYRCITAGNSAGGEPSWPTDIRDTISDGTVDWICEEVASKFETMEFYGVVNTDSVWQLARYHIAVARLRPETYEINVDVEHLVCTRGDLVRLTHDVLLVGLGQARIKVISTDGGGDTDGITIDDSITMSGGSTYSAQFRKADGTMESATIVTDAGEQTVITFNPVIPAADTPAVGDMIFFGETDEESIDCIVTKIEPGSDLNARLTLTDYGAGVFTADSGTIPTYDPHITIPQVENRVPPKPNIESITLNVWPANVADNKQAQLYVSINFSVGIETEIAPYYYEAQYREQDDVGGVGYSDWFWAANVPETARHIEVPVTDGVIYDFRIRSVSQYGITSDWDIEADYTVDHTPTVPNDITGFALVQGGATWSGLDCEMTWDAPGDLWRVDKFRINVYKTAGLVLLRTESVDVEQYFYGYTFVKNSEDNAGSPIGGLTIRIWAVSQHEEPSDSYDELVITHTAPSSITSLAGTSWTGGVYFTWDENTDASFSHFEYRVKVGAALNGEAWVRTQNPYILRMLTTSEKDTYGSTATIYIEVRAVDKFGTASGDSSTNQDASGLDVIVTDIDDFAVTASKIFTKIPIISGDSWTDDTPDTDSVTWNEHTLYFNGNAYTISAGNTDKKYIYWDLNDSPTTYQGTDTHPGDAILDDESFIIATNIDGTHDLAWNAIANQVIGSAFIQNLAVQNAHVNDLSAEKINAGTLDADRIGANSLTVGKWTQDVVDSYGPLVTDPTFHLTTAVDDTNYNSLGGTFAWSAGYGESGPGLRVEADGAGNYNYINDGSGSNKFFPVNVHDKIVVQIRAGKDADFDGNFYIGLTMYDEDDVNLGSVWKLVSLTTSFATYTFQIIPDEATCHYGLLLLALSASGSQGYAFVDSWSAIKELSANYRHGSDVTKIDGGEIYVGSSIGINDATFGNDGIQLDYNSGNPRFYCGDGSNEYLKYDGTNVELSASKADAIVVKSGGNIKVEAGGDVHLIGGAAGSAGEVQWHYGSSGDYVHKWSASAIYYHFELPNNDDEQTFFIGVDTYHDPVTPDQRFKEINLRAVDMISFSCNDDGDPDVYMELDNTLNGEDGLVMGGNLLPDIDSTWRLGKSDTCWTNVYADAGVTGCSDRKYKTEIRQEVLGLEFINALVPISYEWRKDGKRPKNHDGTYHGFIAPEVEAVVEQMGHDREFFAGVEKNQDKNGEEWYGLMYNQMLAPLTKAVQELSEKVDELNEKIKDMEK